MGTQQILLIVLSVIIVGIAVAVGITMFNTQSVNANRQAVLMDLNTFGASAIAYYKTPTDQGGGGRSFEASCDTVGFYLSNDYDASTNTITNDNGTYELSSGGSSNLTIVGVGTEMGRDGATKVGGTMDIKPEETDQLVLSGVN
jgi:hypothetical protein